MLIEAWSIFCRSFGSESQVRTDLCNMAGEPHSLQQRDDVVLLVSPSACWEVCNLERSRTRTIAPLFPKETSRHFRHLIRMLPGHLPSEKFWGCPIGSGTQETLRKKQIPPALGIHWDTQRQAGGRGWRDRHPGLPYHCNCFPKNFRKNQFV